MSSIFFFINMIIPTTSSDSETYTMTSPTSSFLFPKVHSTVLPDPSLFFSPSLLSSPLPTNSFFQNFVLNDGDKPEYIHPYLIKSSRCSVSISYPSLYHNSSLVCHVFSPDLTIYASNNTCTHSNKCHVISSFTDLTVILGIPSSNFRFFLVRGSPFVTCLVTRNTAVSISTTHSILSLTSNTSLTKYNINLQNNQTWILYSSSPINLSNKGSSLEISGGFTGLIRIALLPDTTSKQELILDRFSSCYPVSGNAAFTKPFCLEYNWEKNGEGDLLMLAHPLHVKLLSSNDCDVTVLYDFKYKSIDGELLGIVGNSWVLKSDPISVTWHSINCVKEEAFGDIIAALVKDVESLNPSEIKTNSTYHYFKFIARAARLALIAEEVCFTHVIPAIRKFLKDTIEPWLEGTFNGNSFLYESKWGGIVIKETSTDALAECGYGLYNNHNYHIGYFLYGIAVLSKIDSAWGRKYRPQAYSLMADVLNEERVYNSNYPRSRCFDFYKLHSWAGGLSEIADGVHQELNSSESMNTYYSAALMGLAYGDINLATVASSLTALEIEATQMWRHVRESDDLYPEDFTSNNRVVSVLSANKRDSGLWFTSADLKECRLGIQLIPLLPITEVLFSDVGFVKQLVNWTLPALRRQGVDDLWKGFVHAMQAIYEKETALEGVRKLSRHDGGNSLTNLLWWVHSRD